MSKKYTSNYDIKDFAINNIAPKYFDKELVNGYNLGTIGYITDLYANAAEDMFNTVPILMNEIFPNTAQFPSTIYNHAAIFGNEDVFAKPAKMTTVLLINEQDILRYSKSNNNNFKTYVIDENTYVQLEGYRFKLDYNIKITVKPYKGDYIFTASYDKTFKNSLSNVVNPFIRVKRINYARTKYLALAVVVRQVDYGEATTTIIDNSVLNVPTIDFTYSGELANFEVFYKTNASKEYVQLSKRLVNSRPLKTPFCFYSFKDEGVIELSFSTKENYFKPEYNSEILIKYWTTDGAKANFDLYTGDDVSVYIASDSIYDYNASVPLLAIPQTPSEDGRSKPTLEQLKRINTDNFATVTSYTTEADLMRHFNSFEYKYNQRVIFIKKRDDVMYRLFSAFAIIRDENDYIYKTNTLNAKIYPEEYDLEYSQTGRHILKPGNIFIYNADSRNEVRITGNKIYDDYKLYEEYIYTNPFLMTVSKGGVVGYYLNSRNDKVALEYDYINNTSLVQFICNYIYISRNALKGESTYTLKFVMSATDEDINSPLVNVDGSDTGRIRVLMTIKDKSGKEIGYTFAELKEYNVSSRRYTFETKLETDDYVNVYEKIRVSNLKEMNTGKDIVTMINMVDLDISLYSFFKYDDMVIDHKFSYMEELKEYTLTNSYTTYEDKITLVEPLNVLRSNMKYTRLNEAKYFTLIKDVPLINAEEIKDNDDKFMYLIKQLTNQYSHMASIIYDKTNNYSVDMKFFNTYGRSNNFTVDGTEELLNSVNCDIHFKVSLFNSYSAAETIEEMKIFIKDYFEEVNDNGMNGIYISNLIQSLENEFDDIKYIKFISINGYNTFVQCVENSKSDIDSLSKDDRIAYIPEFLNIDIHNITIDLE